MKQHHMNILVEEKDNMKIKVINMKKMFLFHLNIIEISLVYIIIITIMDF